VPIHDLGYRGWEAGEERGEARWWVIASSGIRLAWKSSWLRRMLMFAWAPALVVAVGFFVYEQTIRQQDTIQQGTPQPGEIIHRTRRSVPMITLLPWLPGGNELLRRAATEPAEQVRHQVWATLLYSFFRYPQGVVLLLLVGLIAPPLISRDVRSTAFLLYFSKPLSRLDYVCGKSAVVWGYLLLITTLPALVLYILGVLLSKDVSVVSYTWDLPLRVLGASVVLLVPTTALALAFSSMTSETRYANFAWFATWTMGWVAYESLTATRLGAGQLADSQQIAEKWTPVSIYHSMGRVQEWIFGLEPQFREIGPPAAMLTTLTLVSFLVLLYRVSSPMRV